MEQRIDAIDAVFSMEFIAQNALNILAPQHTHLISRRRARVDASFERVEKFGFEMNRLPRFGTISKSGQTVFIVAVNPRSNLAFTQRKGGTRFGNSASTQNSSNDQNPFPNFGMTFCIGCILEICDRQITSDFQRCSHGRYPAISPR